MLQILSGRLKETNRGNHCRLLGGEAQRSLRIVQKSFPLAACRRYIYRRTLHSDSLVVRSSEICLSADEELG